MLLTPLYQLSCTSCTFHSINEVVQVVHCTVVHSTLSMKLYTLYIVPLNIPLCQWSCTSCTLYRCTFHSINEVVQVVHSTLSMKLYNVHSTLSIRFTNVIFYFNLQSKTILNFSLIIQLPYEIFDKIFKYIRFTISWKPGTEIDKFDLSFNPELPIQS